MSARTTTKQTTKQGPRSGTAVTLHYEWTTDPSTIDHGPPVSMISSAVGKAGTRSVRVRLSHRGLAVFFDRQTTATLVRDLPARSTLIVNHRAKRFARLDREPDHRRTDTAASPNLSVLPTKVRRVFELQDRTLHAERFDVGVPSVTLEAWALTTAVADPLATRALWELLVPGCSKELGAGVPADLLVRHPKDPGALAARIRLVAIERDGGPDVSLEPPKGYRDRTTREPIRFVANSRLGEPSALAEDRVDTFARALGGAAPPAATATDFAWLTNQAALDQLSHILNTVAGVFDRFTQDGFVEAGGTPGELGILVDWWQQLEPHLAFDDNEAVIKALKRLLVAFKVSEGTELLGLTDDEQTVYVNDVVAPNREPAGRLLAFFFTVFDDDIRDRVADAEREAFSRPIVLGFGLTEFEADVGPGEVTRLRVSRFRNAELVIGHQPIVYTLEFRDGGVRLVLGVERLRADFEFSTKPSGNAESVLCGIFTFGLCAAAVSNWGDGEIIIDNPRLVLDVRPVRNRRSGTWIFRAQLNIAASDMDIEWSALGVNLLQDIVLLAADAADSWSGSIRTQILNGVRGPLSRLPLGTLFRWPTSWHATQGPPVLAAGTAFEPGSGTMLGGLASSFGLLPASPAAPQPELVEPMGHAFSRRFLTAWLRELVGSYARERDIDLDWEKALGIALPDPAVHDARPKSPTGLPEFGDLDVEDRRRGDRDRDDPLALSQEELATRLAGLVEGCEPPPDLPDGYRRRSRLLRTAIEVVLPESDASPIPGRAELTYTILLEAVRSSLVHHREVIPREVCLDLDQPVDDLPRFERLLEADATAAARVAGRGIPSDTTPGLLAGREAAIERYRAAVAFDPQFDGQPGAVRPGGGVIVDPPEGGFEPGVPEPPLRPGRPDLPDPNRRGAARVVCEPPHCEWFTGVVDSVLATYLRAEVRVDADLALGFSPSGGMWLPQLLLTVTGEPELTTVDIATSGPLRDADPDAVESFVHRVVRRNATALLAEATTDEPPATVRPIIPQEAMYLGIPQVVLDILVFEQSGGGTPSFTIDGDHVYWPIEATEQLTGHLA